MVCVCCLSLAVLLGRCVMVNRCVFCSRVWLRKLFCWWCSLMICLIIMYVWCCVCVVVLRILFMF